MTGAADGASAPQPQEAATADPSPLPAAPAPAPAPADAQLDNDLSRRLAGLMNQDHQIRQRAKAVEGQEKALKSQQSELEELRALKTSLQSNPYKVVEQYGGDLTDWANQQSDVQQNPTVTREMALLRQELAELKTGQEQRKQADQERETQLQNEKYQQQIDAFKGQIRGKIAETEAHKLLKIAGLEEHVYSVIERHAAQTNDQFGQAQIMPIEQAAETVHKHYLPILKERVAALLELPDFQELRNGPAAPVPQQATPQPALPAQQQPAAPGPRTLSYQQTAVAPPRGDLPRSREDRINAAKAIMRGE